MIDSAAGTTADPQAQPTGKPVLLGRYETPEGGRVLIGRRIEGEIHVYDAPRSGQGRRYFVDAGFESKAELAVLIADYRRQAQRLGACPMSPEALAATLRLSAALRSPTPAGSHATRAGRGQRLPHRAGAHTKRSS